MKQKYCAYCRCYRDDHGFKEVKHKASNTRRAMCPPCQELRTRPRTELQALAEREREERRSKK